MKLPLTKAEVEDIYRKLGMRMPKTWVPLVEVDAMGFVKLDIDDPRIAAEFVAQLPEFGARDRSKP